MCVCVRIYKDVCVVGNAACTSVNHGDVCEVCVCVCVCGCVCLSVYIQGCECRGKCCVQVGADDDAVEPVCVCCVCVCVCGF
jgi:hypothetical protein